MGWLYDKTHNLHLLVTILALGMLGGIIRASCNNGLLQGDSPEVSQELLSDVLAYMIVLYMRELDTYVYI
jgi:hypothetical protein